MNVLVKNNNTRNTYLTNSMAILPGLATAFIVAVISKVAAIWLPTLGAATIAILLGILLGNTFLKMPILEKGTKIAESKLLEFSVVLLGATVTFQTIAHIGIKGGIFVLLQMGLTIIATYILGKKMLFSDNMSLLMAGGNAVCGSSAIASIAPAIQAKEEEKGQIITLVNLLGTILMLVLPIIGSLIYGSDILTKSALIGGILQSVGQVVASASMINGQVVELAMLFKIMRIMLLVVVVYFFGRFKQQSAVTTAVEVTPKKKTSALPWYVVGFVLFCVINSLVHLPTQLSETAHFFSGWFEITALAAIGLRLDFQKFFKEGKRFLIYGLSVGVIQVVLAIALIALLRI
ncbi:YeiH family protein [Candidatus Enterococcus ikei]|uniref:Sulfate exporter family transporter n=1 Tax=Candidatus Enterococcus ikei TaxID=2815326 RepID=A0ABS3GVG2_9ENTE|nr:putative sulfate exporter family transporter [Enterococcus sp. DIV0869a]MBO0439245.1 putative sulfate exporter family transporter [Enterococcus sp. DIV0869a]